MKAFITSDTPVTQEVLNTIAHLPTRSLATIVEDGGCPIGGVIIDDETRRIVGKGHNTLVQENHPYNHGETSAARDAGRLDFGKTTIFTTLTPCEICATLIHMRQFKRVVIGDVTNASGTEQMMRDKGVQVDILEDPEGIALYARYRKEKPDQDLEDWRGVAAVRKGETPNTTPAVSK
jgi:creatinine deaminase